ncbi:outer membrane beta-barrel protein [Ferruginibacter profundus]
MSNNQRFDDNIKEQFQDYTPEVHPRIWENIVKEREKRRPAGFWLNFFNGRNILLLTALLIATGSGAYLLLKNTDKKDAASTVAANTATPATLNNNNKTNTTASTSNVTATSESEQTNNTPVTITNTENAVASPGSKTAAGINVAEDAGNNNTAITSDNSNKTTGFNTITSGGASRIKIRSPFAQSGEDNSLTTTGKKNKNSATTNAADDIDDDNSPGNNADKALQDFYLRRLIFADIQRIGTEKKTATLKKNFLPNIFLPDCPSIEKDAAGNKSYIEVYGGPDIAFRSLSDTGNSAYLQKRKESTKFSSAYSAGIRYTKVFGNGMSIRTGINYSQINEKFTFVQGNLVQITYIINANGDTTGSYITTGTRYKTTINKFRTIDVPVLIGYEMGNGRLHANINAGIIVNAYSWQKGDVLDTAFRPVSITTGKTSSPYQFKTNIGVGFMAGASFYYKLNDKIHVLAEPYFRYNLSPMSKEKLTLTQKYNSAGIRLGLRVDLH